MQFGPQDAPPQRPPPGDRIDHRRVRLQRHADAQPVAIDRRHHPPLGRLARFLLDDRGEDDRLFGRRYRDVGFPFRPGVRQIAVHRRLHPRHHGRARVATLKGVAVRQDRPLGRHRHLPGQAVRPHQRVMHQGRWVTLRHHHHPLADLAVLQQRIDLAGAGSGGHVILARLDRPATAKDPREQAETGGGADRPGLFQLGRRACQAGALRHHHRHRPLGRAGARPHVRRDEPRQHDGGDQHQQTAQLAHRPSPACHKQRRPASPSVTNDRSEAPLVPPLCGSVSARTSPAP